MKVSNYPELMPYLTRTAGAATEVPLLVTRAPQKDRKITVAPTAGVEFHLVLEQPIEVKIGQTVTISLAGETEGTITSIDDKAPVVSMESKPGSASSGAMRNQ